MEGRGTPVVVLDAGITDQMDRLRPLQQGLARVTRGRFVLTEGSSHYLYLDAPDLVEQAVRSVIDQARVK